VKISTRGRYGLRALVDLANNNENPRLLKDIAASQNISMKYLGQIISSLKSAGIISRTSQGYILAVEPEQLSCFEIITTLEGSLAPVDCIDNPRVCERFEDCTTSAVWERMQKALKNELEQITLADLASDQVAGKDLLKKENTDNE